MTDLSAELHSDQFALRHEVGAVRLQRDVIRGRGADVITYLQGQLSQDVAGLTPGVAVRSLVLEPTGKVDGWFRVWSGSDDEVLIDLDAGAGAAVLERLNRFRLRVAAEFELLDWQLVAIRGPATPTIDDPAVLAVGAQLVTTTDWAGLTGLDLLGPSLDLPEGLRSVAPAALEVLRIESGQPAMGLELGAELDPQVIPAEAGEWLIEQSVSFSKGCYTGQELVARVDSRGSNTPRKLRGVLIGGDQEPPAGAEVVVADTVRGALSSVGRSAELGAPVALAYVHRSVEPGTPAVVRWTAADGSTVLSDGEVRALPLVGG